MKRSVLCLVLPLLALSACASPQAKLQAGLENAGLSPRMSACMADRMVHRLSLVQLRRIQSLGSLPRADIHGMTVEQFLYRVRALRDDEILEVSSKAALACALGL